MQYDVRRFTVPEPELFEKVSKLVYSIIMNIVRIKLWDLQLHGLTTISNFFKVSDVKSNLL